MKRIHDIYDAIAAKGFVPSTLQVMDEYINDIENGSSDFPRFNQQEHSGLCKAGSALIGASIVAGYAARSLAASSDAASCQGGPANWQIDELQEKLIVQWAKAAHLWVEEIIQQYPSALHRHTTATGGTLQAKLALSEC